MRRFICFWGFALTLVSSSFAVSLKITWDSVNQDEVFGYRVHWGMRSKIYDHHIDVGKSNTHQIDSILTGVRYYCAVTAVNFWGKESDYSSEVSFQTDEEPQPIDVPSTWELAPGYPNPFQAGKSSIVKLAVPTSSYLSLSVYNVLGQKVRTLHTGSLDPGYHAFSWDGRDDNQQYLPSAIYFYHLQSGNGFLTRSVFLLH